MPQIVTPKMDLDILFQRFIRSVKYIVIVVSISALLTFLTTKYGYTTYYWSIVPINPIIPYVAIAPLLLVFLSGFLSKDKRVGFLTGVVTSVLSVCVRSCVLNIGCVGSSIILNVCRTQISLDIFIISGLVAGVVGVIGAYKATLKETINAKEHKAWLHIAS